MDEYISMFYLTSFCGSEIYVGKGNSPEEIKQRVVWDHANTGKRVIVEYRYRLDSVVEHNLNTDYK